MNQEQWRVVCEQELGKPYLWGGEGPQGYDCSGFAQWALRHLNLDPPSDQTADGLYRFFSQERSRAVDVGQTELGDLAFFGTDEAVTHVGIAWGRGDMIEAGGGGRTTTTVQIAREQQAEVRIRPIARRSDLVAVLRLNALPWRVEAAAAVAPESPARTRGGLAAPPLADNGSFGRYENAPPLTEWLDDGRHMRLKRSFGYVEESGREWPVPAEAVVDGASIPQAFWSLIGGPFEGRYRDASIVHDHYCDVRTRDWRETHRVFYEAMRCSGVAATRAKIMYYAVYRFGPRWIQGQAAVATGFEAVRSLRSVPTALPVDAFDAASFEADAELIQRQDPDLATIEALAEQRSPAAASAVSEGAGGLPPPDASDAATRRVAADAAATFARQPLLQQLVELQDAAADGVAAESVGSLLSRFAYQMRGDTLALQMRESTPARGRARAVQTTPTFEQLKPKYEALYATCEIRPERAGEVAWHRGKLVQYRPRYEAVSALTGVPWWFIGVVHALEASFNFKGHLHNGDPLTARTVQVPKGRPPVWNPPSDWESSALDALRLTRLHEATDWSLARVLFRWESYNGFGYYPLNINSPYLWSFSRHYSKGKFVADRVFDANAVSRQCGAAVMLKALQLAGLVSLP